LQAYALDLENPPYLVVSDMLRIVVHTNWTNTVSARNEFSLDDLRHGGRLEDLRAAFQGSERLKPGISPQEITAKDGEGSGKDVCSRLVLLSEIIYQGHMDAASGATRCRNTKF
jgi:hypothetical protein